MKPETQPPPPLSLGREAAAKLLADVSANFAARNAPTGCLKILAPYPADLSAEPQRGPPGPRGQSNRTLRWSGCRWAAKRSVARNHLARCEALGFAPHDKSIMGNFLALDQSQFARPQKANDGPKPLSGMTYLFNKSANSNGGFQFLDGFASY